MVAQNKRQTLTSEKKTVLVLYSGGDSPGMNMHLRCTVRIGRNGHNANVIGVKDGYLGLVRTCQRIQDGRTTPNELRHDMEKSPGKLGLARRDLDLVMMDHPSVQGLAGQGGITMGSARCPSFRNAHVREQVIALLESLGFSAVIVIGGDGSAAGARQLAAESTIQVLAVPATIDNDLPCTETALGFDTAVNNAVRAVEQYNDTAGAHHRIIVVETMGRDSGRLAEATALAAGAEIAVVPERPVLDNAKMERIAKRLEMSMRRGRDHAIVVVAEGVQSKLPSPDGPASVLGAYLEEYFTADDGTMTHDGDRPDVEVRVCILGHVQRGGHPTAADASSRHGCSIRIALHRRIHATVRCAGPAAWADLPSALHQTGMFHATEPSNVLGTDLGLYNTGKVVSKL